MLETTSKDLLGLDEVDDYTLFSLLNSGITTEFCGSVDLTELDQVYARAYLSNDIFKNFINNEVDMKKIFDNADMDAKLDTTKLDIIPVPDEKETIPENGEQDTTPENSWVESKSF